MEFVGPNEVFGLLCYIAVFVGRDELGRDGCAYDVDKRGASGAIGHTVGKVLHEVPYKGLWYAGANAVIDM